MEEDTDDPLSWWLASRGVLPLYEPAERDSAQHLLPCSPCLRHVAGTDRPQRGSYLSPIPLTQYFISSYGPRGALLLVGGLQMHALISGCLLRPVSYYAVRKKRPPAANEQNGEHSQQKADDLHTTQPIVTSSQHCQKNSLDTELEYVTIKLLDDSDRPKADHPTASHLAPEQDDRFEVRPSSTELDLNVVTVESDLSTPGAPQNGLRKAETDKQMRRVSCEDDQHQAEPLLSQRQETSRTLPSTNTESRGISCSFEICHKHLC